MKNMDGGQQTNEPKDMMSMMEDMDSKMDMIMKHLGIENVSKDEYMAMPDEEKDKIDEMQAMKGQ